MPLLLSVRETVRCNLKYSTWSAKSVYTLFVPERDHVDADFDFWHGIVMKSDHNEKKNDSYTIRCMVFDSDIVTQNGKHGEEHTILNKVSAPKWLDDPYVRWLYASSSETFQRSDQHSSNEYSLQYSKEGALLGFSLDVVCTRTSKMFDSRFVDSLLAVSKHRPHVEQIELVRTLFGITVSSDQTGIRYEYDETTKSIRCLNGKEFESIVSLAIHEHRRIIREYVKGPARLCRAKFVAAVGKCPMRRVRYESCIFSLSSQERVTLLCAMCDAFRTGDREFLWKFSKMYATELIILFRNFTMHGVIHAPLIEAYLHSARSSCIDFFYQMSFSFEYLSDKISLESDGSLVVQWIRSEYTITTVRSASGSLKMYISYTTKDSYYTLDGLEFVKRTKDVMRLQINDEVDGWGPNNIWNKTKSVDMMHKPEVGGKSKPYPGVSFTVSGDNNVVITFSNTIQSVEVSFSESGHYGKIQV